MIEVKYQNVVVGHSYDGTNIILDNTEEAKSMLNMMVGTKIGISSRRIGTITDNCIEFEKINELSIIKLNP